VLVAWPAEAKILRFPGNAVTSGGPRQHFCKLISHCIS
jgi:hypothetical protein